MRLKTACWVALAVAVAGPAWAETHTSLRVQLGLGNAPPPPAVFFDDTPPVVVVPRTAVYVVRHDRDRDYDFFRYGVYWYIWNDGYWYRGRSYRGPFTVIHPRYVPGAIYKVPAKHWRHHPHGGPPGLRKQGDRDRYVVVKEKRGHRHGREDD